MSNILELGPLMCATFLHEPTVQCMYRAIGQENQYTLLGRNGKGIYRVHNVHALSQTLLV